MTDLKPYETIKGISSRDVELSIFAQAIHQNPDVVVITDRNGTIVYTNPCFTELTGYTAEEAVGQNPRVLKSGEMRPEVYKELWSTILSGRVWHGEFKNRRKDGSTFWEEASIGPIFNEDGEITHFVAIKHDISLRKEMQAVLQKTVTQFRTLTASTHDAIIVIDESCTVHLWNNGASNYFGYLDREVVGKSLKDILRAQDTPLNSFRQWIKSPERIQKQIETKIQHKNGQWIPVEISFSNMKIEAETYAVLIIRNIQERKKNEQKLRQLHFQNEQLIKSLASVLIVTDSDERVIRWNSVAESTFGIPAEKIIGKPITNTGIQWNWEKVLEAISICRLEKTIQHISDLNYTGNNGKTGFLNLSFSPYPIDNTEYPGFIILGQDITDQKVMESQLMQSQKLESIGQLAAGIAHEINSPTQFVADNIYFLNETFRDMKPVFDLLFDIIENRENNLETIRERLTGIVEEIDMRYLLEEVPQAFQQTMDGLDRVSTIVRAMKQFSHPGAKEKQPYDVNEAIRTTVMISKNEWKYVADLNLELDEHLPVVNLLVDEFNQVILNMIVNAVHAIADKLGENAAEKGKITISTADDGDYVRIDLLDSGRGIPEEIISRVFDPFFTTKEIGKGTGQGLAISHDIIVNKHQGFIEVQSTPGEGTMFTIRLPKG